MKKKSALILTAAAVTGIYSVVNGKGIFNKIRFKEQRDAVERYVAGHYLRAVFTPITAAGNGWTTIILRHGMPKIFLYLTRSADNVYVFHESNIKEK